MQRDIESQVQSIESLAQLMDSQFPLPGTKMRIGVDTIIGLIPGIGDTISLSIAGYIVLQSARLGVGSQRIMQMLINIFIDWLIGLIPIIGDFFDIGWKGNLKNAAILRRYAETVKISGDLS
jgi:hypothetical protein